jgi:hypothetical protein
MKLTQLYYFLFVLSILSCSQSDEIINTLDGRWTLTSTSGNQGDIALSSPWTVINIEDRTFQLLNIEDEEEEIAKGLIEYCPNSVLSDCYLFSIEFKKVGINLLIESSGNKIVSYLDGELSFSSVCCNEISYIFRK